ncbi:Undecaprenyl-diphosphatase [Roseovarius lutimaris]|uniref:Undecaprenyl-diphosphatase n=1 Tax=Roseovarius lutimaris TaxID=1005928 RepID=A0A1I4ZYB0_9RHOB|nr:undecaprenyl-diphosphate phosphatase [Roseovarius lutimaris]SFN55090.1 Undecaprenyl-diphosphatase [Roseovarius lutimaris]
MPLFHIILVAALQGVTEFLPISSSGHLILLPKLTGLQDQGQMMDVAVHVGTLLAVMIYFWGDLRDAIIGLGRLLRGRADTPGARLALLLVIATVPVIAFGVLLQLTGLEDKMRSITVIGWTTLVFGLVLYWSDQTGKSVKTADDWTVKDAITLGFWQAVALIPGTSRSGITITGARFLGYERRDAAKVSMLMSVPTIFASGVFLGGKVALDADLALLRDGAIAALFAFGAALLALSLMMRLLRSVSFTPYVIYRIILGLSLLGFTYL